MELRRTTLAAFIALTLAAGIFNPAIAAMSAKEKYKACDEVRESIRRTTNLDRYLRAAFREFSKATDTIELDLASRYLKAFFLNDPDTAVIRCKRQLLTSEGVPEGFLMKFDEISSLTQETIRLPGGEVYSLFVEYRDLSFDPESGSRLDRRINKLEDVISKKLLQLAVDKKFPLALREYANIHLRKDKKHNSACLGESALKELVRQGDSTAAIEIANHYLKGDVLKLDKVRAAIWFWIAGNMGRENDVENILKSIYSQLTKDELEDVMYWAEIRMFPTCERNS